MSDSMSPSVADIATRGTTASRPADAVANEMVERVARAIYAAHCSGFVPPIYAHWDTDHSGRALAMADARAAIEAMREPTQHMLDNAGEGGIPDRCYREIYTAMIDAALNPGSPS